MSEPAQKAELGLAARLRERRQERRQRRAFASMQARQRRRLRVRQPLLVRRLPHGRVGDTIAAGLAGAACSAIPSTAWSWARGDDVLDGARAAGSMLLPREQRTALLLVAAVPVHLVLSLGWAGVIVATLPRRAEPAWGVASGLAIAALDLSVIGRRIPAIRALPQGRQWADHVAYGLGVGLVLWMRRSGGAPGEER